MFPKLIEIGSFFIPTYGALIALGVLTAVFLSSRLAKKEGFNENQVEQLVNLTVYTVFGGIIGSKFLLLVIDGQLYLSNPKELIYLLRAGGVFYGGLIGGTITALYFLRKYKLPLLKLGDILAPHLALAQFFGRLGCYSAGCCYGKECHHDLCVTFTNKFAHSVTGVPLNIPLIPIQLINALNVLTIFFVLRFIIFKRKKFNGQVLLSYFLIYSVTRGISEFFRGDIDRGFLFGGYFSTSQFIGMIVFSIALVIYIKLKNNNKEKTQ